MKQNIKFYNFIKIILKPFLKLLYPYEIRGVENAESLQKGYIICANHLSNLDPAFLMLIHPAPISFMAKAELFANKLLDIFFTSLGAFAVNRGKGDKAALNHAEEVLGSGGVLGLFIEGTRSKTGEFLRPKSGAVLLASKMGCAVLPVCITGSSPDNKIHIFKKTIISYGKPIPAKELNITENSYKQIRSATTLVMDKIKALRS